MDQSIIFGPLFAMVLLTLMVWVTMFARRIPWIQSGDLTAEQLQPGEFERIQPEHVANPSSNFKNLFEIPVLFYVLTMYLFVTGSVDMIYLAGAWVFTLTRYVHSFIHCTFNHVMMRFVVYLIGTFIVWLMAARAAYQLVIG
jgi:hypothetical protein